MSTTSPDRRGQRVVRKTLADGTVKTYTYDRPPKKRVKVAPLREDTIQALLNEYELSPEWNALAPRTKRNRLIALRPLRAIATFLVKDWRRRDILLMRDGIAKTRGPAAANVFVSNVSVLLAYAQDRNWIEANPATRVRSIASGEYPTWTEAELSIALRAASEPVRRAIVLAVHTGQRRGDLCQMRWGDVAGGVLRIVQEKTKQPVIIPLSRELKRELAAWRRDTLGDTILSTAAGNPWNRDKLSEALIFLRGTAGLRDKLNMHGLRKLAATRLADAGCTPHEIAAITGHKTLAEVERYTVAANREKLAGSAMDRLKTARATTAPKLRKIK